ncbi:hypothetical protein [Elstera sp.]|jgi:hypothetical protein|uniref:hypothetical protein n=1 Tax=Elstera sp. TaxID=1916664 RepID=UPI0037BFAAF6
MPFTPLNFGSLAPNDGESFLSAFGKVNNMLAEIYQILGTPVAYPQMLQSLAALTGVGLVRRTDQGLAGTVPFSSVGEALLGATSPASVRGMLQLGSAALLSTTGAGSVVTRGPDGKIAPGDLGPAAVMDVFDAATEIEMLALDAQKGDLCLRPSNDPLKPGYIEIYMLSGAGDPTVLANWRLLTEWGPESVASVFGLRGIVKIDGLTQLPDAVGANDMLVLQSAASGLHYRVSRAALVAGLAGAITASVISGLVVGGTVAAPALSLSGLRLPDGSGQVAAQTAGLFCYDTNTGAPFRQPLAGLIAALPPRAGLLNTDKIMVSVAGGVFQAPVSALLAGRRLAAPTLSGALIEAQPLIEVNGPLVLATLLPARLYRLRLLGDSTLVLPDRSAAPDTQTEFELVVDQDGIGNHALILQAQPGQNLRWHNGLAQGVCLTGGGRTRFKIQGLAGETRWDVAVTHKDE